MSGCLGGEQGGTPLSDLGISKCCFVPASLLQLFPAPYCWILLQGSPSYWTYARDSGSVILLLR